MMPFRNVYFLRIRQKTLSKVLVVVLVLESSSFRP